MADKRGDKGFGTISKTKNGKFLVKVPVSTYSSGASRYVTRTVATKAEASRLRKKLLAERENNKLVAGPRRTFRDVSEAVLFASRDDIYARTADQYLRNLRLHVFPRIGSKVLSALTVHDVETVLNEVRLTKSASTVNNVRTAISKVFTEAMRLDLVTNNPVLRTKKAKKGFMEPTNVKPPWTQEEAVRVIEDLRDTPLFPMLEIFLSTAMREGEVLGLQWSDIDYATNSITVSRTISYDSILQPDGSRIKGLSIREPKTSRSRRTIKVPSPVLDGLRQQEAIQSVMKAEAGGDWKEGDWVFTNNVGNPVDASKLRKIFNKTLDKFGIRRIRIHDMRHSVATILLEQDSGNLAAISRMLGHSSIAITIDIYGATARVEDQASTAMGKILFGDDVDFGDVTEVISESQPGHELRTWLRTG